MSGRAIRPRPHRACWAGAVLVVPVTVVGAGLLLGACGNPYPGKTVGQQVQSWESATSFPASLSALEGDATRIDTLETRHDPAALRTGCDVLVTDALSANQNLPTPDDQLTSILSAAYTAAAVAGRDCLRGASGDAVLLARSAAGRATAQAGYIKAQARVDALTTPGAGS